VVVVAFAALSCCASSNNILVVGGCICWYVITAGTGQQYAGNHYLPTQEQSDSVKIPENKKQTKNKKY
jgi:hypothetical protein